MDIRMHGMGFGARRTTGRLMGQELVPDTRLGRRLLSFYEKIRKHYQNDNEVAERLLTIIASYRYAHRDITKTAQHFRSLFKSHPELLDMFSDDSDSEESSFAERN